MIGRLEGAVVAEEPDGSVVLDVRGVGYELWVPLGALGRAATGRADRDLVLWVHTHVREDSFELFGFANELERRVFRVLLGVPNVGPKLALATLSALSVVDLASAVERKDHASLARVPGIGKKTAERLVLELREKLPRMVSAPATSGAPSTARPAPLRDKLVGALVGMGYRPAEAERGVSLLDEEFADAPLADQLKRVLGLLSR